MTFRTWLQILLGTAACAALVALAVFVYLDWRQPADISIGPATAMDIAVWIDGAVATPGVVTIPAGSRLVDAIAAGGGLAPDADLASLNLAERVFDGEHVVVARAGTEAGANDAGTPVSGGYLININTAPVAELDQLPGIGPVIAQRIVDYREANGPFTSVDQLAQVEGISAQMVDDIRSLVTIGG